MYYKKKGFLFPPQIQLQGFGNKALEFFLLGIGTLGQNFGKEVVENMRETRIIAVNCSRRESAENVDLCRRCVTESLAYSPNGNEDEGGGN